MKANSQNFTILLQKEEEGGFTVTVPALPGCVTYGKDLDEAKKMAKEAIELYLESMKDHDDEIINENEVFYTQITVQTSIQNA